MLRRSTKIQLIIFVIITLLGISYVSANYVGLFNGLFGPTGCTVHADFADSGGIFTNAEVTYRGVAVGNVGSLHLIDKGVRADLQIENCSSPKIPVTSAAQVSDRSVIGEQYVNLIPPNNNGPYFGGGEIIPMSRTTIPVSAETLLTNLDRLVNSVDTAKLSTVVTELGNAFNNRGPALGALLDSTNNLLVTAQQNLPQTIDLINNAGIVLDRQLAESGPLRSFTHSLNLLSAQLKKSDPDIRNLLSNGPADLDVIRQFVLDNRTDLGAVLANLASTGRVMVRHIGAIEEIFELYPVLVGGGLSTVHSDGVAALGLISNVNDPPDCGDPRKGSEGYQGTTIRSPADLSPAAPNTAAHCTAAPSGGTNVRGSANVPGGDQISTSGAGVVYPRGTTENTLRIGTSLNQAGVLADQAWLAILTDSLH